MWSHPNTRLMPCLGHQPHKDLGAGFAVCPRMPSCCFGSPLRAGGARARRGCLCFHVSSPVLLQPHATFAAPAARELSVFSQNTLLSCLRGWSDSKANIANPEINNPCCIKGSNLFLPRTAALSPGELCFPPAAQQSLRSSGLSAVPTAERPSATCTSVPWSYKQIFPPPTSPPHQFFC